MNDTIQQFNFYFIFKLRSAIEVITYHKTTNFVMSSSSKPN